MKRFALALTFFLLMTGFVHAQDDAPPVVTATVVYPTVNIRWMPEDFFHRFSDLDSKIGELHAGDRLTVLRWEDIPTASNFGITERTWVYVSHLESGLIGWVTSEFLRMDSPDWQRRLPVFRGWPELVAFVVENAPEGLLAVVVVGEGEPPHLNMHAEPYISSTEVGQLLDGTIVRVLGRASVNGRPSGYVYVRDIASGMEGWVSRSGLWTLARHPQAYFPSNGLPILYDVNTLGQTIGLPRLRLTNFNLREAPDHDAHILRDAVNYHSFYATAGRSADSEWIKVVVLITGEVGWVAASIIEPGTLDIESLPVVE